MKNLKKQVFLTSLLCLFVVNICLSQTTPSKVAMPTQQNKIIIDKIVEAAHYKNHVIDFCLTTINEAALAEKWNDQKTVEVSESINYKNFRDAVYNMFAFYNEIELETLLKTYKQDIVYQTTNVMTTNDALAYNLEIFANDIVRGKYISK
ncbi:hypothetical protein [Flavobacterium hibernum]|uniref:DUF4476 domain-containing protein n=1 Tax=Flavobacterium hibernum TaxID=37752 RepID=A0A0D0EED3_9FLAO|nr:hypothetical protein [Flavobacterium hibernum]KIO52154.1 hypothetical protein IW18_13590 [Flavobacterium hibernum]OXA87000.1 hypothetical protein B0A73_11840 [Flavobacterium hibernum]STO14035.1 Uncharacterised protein [Flavobacterium hibernum]